ncbi:MAG: T9SS type A sorting domain-containing protein [Bacteroidetes bacterium]|nr:T9SS type A sorting domain-containing protein [Bacteroidota bacterium]
MRKSTLLFLLIFILAKLQAQNYLISFEGSGASTTVDSVKVENLTQFTSLTLAGGNQLNLVEHLTGIDQRMSAFDNPLRIFPNPSRGKVDLSFEVKVNAVASIEIFDLQGRRIAKSQFTLNSGHQNFLISGLNSGIYTVIIKTEGSLYTGKIISHSSSGQSIEITNTGSTNGHSSNGSLKSNQAIVQMQYNSGDLLKFTGKSGIYATVVMDIPTSSKTISFAFAPCTDYDNNHYTIVHIGTQTWTEENLKSTHYPDGTTADYFDYDHDPNNSLIYGRLYAWSSAMNGAASSNTNPSNVQGICPNGWHLPSKSEWQQLAGSFGGSDIAGGKLKETGNAHWISPNTGATDEVGFTALPAGIWAFWDEFQWKGDHGAFSTSTGNLPMVEVTTIMLQTSNGVLTVGTFHPDDAVSVRCVKD